MSDSLSRDNDRSDKELTNILYSCVPSQMPEHFKIVSLPSKIVSWMTSLLHKLPIKEQLREKHMRTKLGHGEGGSPTANPFGSMTSTYTDFQEVETYKSLEPLPWLFVKGDFQDHLMIPWLKAQSKKPSHMFLQNSERMGNQTRPRTKTATLDAFYQGFSEHSEIKTQTQSSRRHCP